MENLNQDMRKGKRPGDGSRIKQKVNVDTIHISLLRALFLWGKSIGIIILLLPSRWGGILEYIAAIHLLIPSALTVDGLI